MIIMFLISQIKNYFDIIGDIKLKKPKMGSTTALIS